MLRVKLDHTLRDEFASKVARKEREKCDANGESLGIVSTYELDVADFWDSHGVITSVVLNQFPHWFLQWDRRLVIIDEVSKLIPRHYTVASFLSGSLLKLLKFKLNTSLILTTQFPDKLSKGILSLADHCVEDTDGGYYTCFCSDCPGATYKMGQYWWNEPGNASGVEAKKFYRPDVDSRDWCFRDDSPLITVVIEKCELEESDEW